jgi:hypothetical protein
MLKLFLLLESNNDGEYNTNIKEDELANATIWFPGFLMNNFGEAATGKLKLTPTKNTSCDLEAYTSAKEAINSLINQFDNLTQSSNAITELNNLKARVDGNLLQEAFIDCSVVLNEMLDYSSVTEQSLTTECVVSLEGSREILRLKRDRIGDSVATLAIFTTDNLIQWNLQYNRHQSLQVDLCI